MDTNGNGLPRFPLGRVVATANLLDTLGEPLGDFLSQELLACLKRHHRGDWGEVPPEDAQENELSLRKGFRLLSAYTVRGVKVWVITEADRSSTTLLLPEDY